MTYIKAMCPHGYHHSTVMATATKVITALLFLLSLLLSFLVYWYKKFVT